MTLEHEISLTHEECIIIEHALYVLMLENPKRKDYSEVSKLRESFIGLLK